MSQDSPFVILDSQDLKGSVAKRKSQIASGLANVGLPSRIMLAKEPEDVGTLAYDAVLSKESLLLVAGGDKSVNAVVDGMLRASDDCGLPCPSFGIVPIGCSNDFAWTFGLPFDVPRACAVIRRNRIRRVDVGRLHGGLYPEGRYFVNGVGMGFEPMVTFLVDDFPHLSGRVGYILAFCKIVLDYPPPFHIELRLDGKRTILDTQQISICNGRRMGSAFLMGPGAIPDDGLFDVVFANRPIGSGRVVPVALRFFKGRQVKLPEFTSTRAERISVVCSNGPMPVHADGVEISRACMSFDVEMHPSRLPLLV